MTNELMRVQLKRTEEVRFRDNSFNELVVKGLCLTKCSDLYYDFCFDVVADYLSLTEYERKFIEKNTRGFLRDGCTPDEMTYGGLCALVDCFQHKIPGDRGADLVSQPFQWSSYIDLYETNHPDAPRRDVQKRRCHTRNVFDPFLLNTKYGLCDDDEGARFFYWARYLSRMEYFNAVSALSKSRRVKALQRSRMFRDEMDSYMMNLGSGWITGEFDSICPEDRAEMIDTYLIKPLADLHYILRNKGE